MKNILLIGFLLITSLGFSQVRAEQVRVNSVSAGIVATNAQAAITELKSNIDDINGSETIVTAGTNVTVTGTGTTANPYVVNSTASGTTDAVLLTGVQTISGEKTITSPLNLEDDFNVSVNNSTLTNPRVVGFNDFSAGKGVRVQFGDAFNTLQNAHSKGMDIYAYNTLRLKAGQFGTPATLPFQDNIADVGILLEPAHTSKKIVARGVAGQTVDIFQVRNSADAVLFGVAPNGNVTTTGTVTANGVLLGSGGSGIPSNTAEVTGSDAITNIISMTQAEYNAGSKNASTYHIITDAPLIDVVTSSTISLNQKNIQYNDQSTDVGTITFNNVVPGGSATVYINRASAPTLSGTGLTFNQLPNTTSFSSGTQMAIYFEAIYNGTTIDYYYYAR